MFWERHPTTAPLGRFAEFEDFAPRWQLELLCAQEAWTDEQWRAWLSDEARAVQDLEAQCKRIEVPDRDAFLAAIGEGRESVTSDRVVEWGALRGQLLERRMFLTMRRSAFENSLETREARQKREARNARRRLPRSESIKQRNERWRMESVQYPSKRACAVAIAQRENVGLDTVYKAIGKNLAEPENSRGSPRKA